MSGKVLKIGAIQKSYKSSKNKKRLGRGVGSGHGKTAGKGHKGQWARKGKDVPVGFEGGQMELYRRIPKSGFYSRVVKPTEITPETLFNLETDSVTIEALRDVYGRTHHRFKIVLNNASNSDRVLKLASAKKIVLNDDLKITKGAKLHLESKSWTIG